jgi:ABC-2 type transport system permease protein
MTAETPPQSSLVAESLLFASRHFTRWRRYPIVPLQSLLFPTFLLITYDLLIGKSMMRITGADSLYGLVPMCAVAGGMFGALGAAFAIPPERDSGLLSRLWTFPVHRASALTGALLAEAARTLVGAVLVTVVGVGLGLRFHGGWLMVIPFLLIPVVVVVVFATVVMTAALSAKSESAGTLFTWLGTGSIGLVFCSAGVAPISMFPSWLQPVVAFQPMSPTIESMRGLAEGGPVLWPLMVTFGWVFGLAAIFGPLAVRGYRTAAESG